MKIKIKSCGDCTFHDKDYDYCDAHDWTGGKRGTNWKDQIIYSFSNNSEPPQWCPLRTEPIVIELED